MRQIVMCEIMDADEGEMIRVQTKIKTYTNANAIIMPSGAKIENGMRRQRSPAASVSGRAPGDPCRTPDPVRAPDPTAMRVRIPAAIMERRPSPGISRSPVPAAIGVNPIAVVAIGTPAWRDGACARLPAPADTRDDYPRAVRSQIVIEVRYVRRWRLSDRFLRS